MKTQFRNHFLNHLLIGAIFLFVSFGLKIADVRAGGMISSGGELLKNARNPWWVKNTSNVRYCVAIDASTVSATPAKINALVDQALRYWTVEFNRPMKLIKSKELFNAHFKAMGVGQQTFHRTNCDGTEDLRFQVGYGTLTAEQKSFIPNLRSHIGVTMRTDYDEKQLKGRGFIYIASDVGPNGYDGQGQTIEKPWQYEVFLYYALVHELGHVFGLPHGGEAYSLMSERFLEYSMDLSLAPQIKDLKVLTSPVMPLFFFVSNYFVHCPKTGFTPAAILYFSLPPNARCVHFGIVGDNQQILMYATNQMNSLPIYVGLIRELDLEGEAHIGVMLHYPKEQEVFESASEISRFIAGPTFIDKDGSGTFFPTSGAAKPLFIDLSPTRFKLIGIDGARLVPIMKGPISILPQ